MAKQDSDGNRLPELSDAEWEVMKVLWDDGPMAARDIYAAIPDKHGWAYKTVKSLLGRLVTKSALDYTQVGNSYLYRPSCPREEMTKKETRGFLDRVFGKRTTPAITNIIRDTKLTDQEIEGLRLILDEKAREAKRQQQKGRR